MVIYVIYVSGSRRASVSCHGVLVALAPLVGTLRVVVRASVFYHSSALRLAPLVETLYHMYDRPYIFVRGSVPQGFGNSLRSYVGTSKKQIG